MHKLNIVSAIRKMAIKEFRDLSHENCYRQVGFTKENSFYSRKRQKKRFTIIRNQFN